jgi:hypothetical protein
VPTFVNWWQLDADWRPTHKFPGVPDEDTGETWHMDLNHDIDPPFLVTVLAVDINTDPAFPFEYQAVLAGAISQLT